MCVFYVTGASISVRFDVTPFPPLPYKKFAQRGFVQHVVITDPFSRVGRGITLSVSLKILLINLHLENCRFK
jgi:hypothetical protein